jgi:uncharacterized membrane protein/outer membrane protein assembly factor BamB
MLLDGGPRRVLVILLVAMMLVPAVPIGGPAVADEGPRAAPLASTPANQWPMFAHDPAHTGMADHQSRGLPSPGGKWAVTTTAVDGHATAIGNFSRNVRATNASIPWTSQLHCAVFASAARVWVVEGSEGRILWAINLTGQNLVVGPFNAAPAIGDVDGDARMDIVLASLGGVLYAYEPVILWNGTQFTYRGDNFREEQLWNTTGRTIGTVSASSVVLEDLGANGTLDAIVGSSLGVFCFNARYGSELWNRSLSGFSISTPAVYRVGTQRNVVATSLNTTTAPVLMHAYTLRGTTGAVIKRLAMPISILLNTVPFTVPFLPSPVAADLDGQKDGDEIVIVQPYLDNVAHLIVYRDGDLDAANVAYNRSLGGATSLEHVCLATPAVADLDGDRGLDLAVACWRVGRLASPNTYTNVTVLDGASGNTIWATDIDDTIGLDLEWDYSSPVLCDVDRDGRPDVLVAQYNGKLSALSGRNGTRLWQYNTRGFPTARLATSAAAGDLDLDGYTDVVLNGQAISALLPDLAIAGSDITFTVASPDEGEVVGIDVLVRNRGTADARDILVTVLDGPDLAGNATVPTVVAGGSYSARVTYQFFGRVDHTVTARVDPLGAIEELREDNNNASASIRINSMYGVVLDCPDNETIIDPGTTWHFFAEARNVGRYGNRIAVTLAGAPASWSVGVNPGTFTLGAAGSPTDRTTVDVSVRVDPSTPAGEYAITVTATSQNDTRDHGSVVLTTVVKGRWGLHLAPADSRKPVAPGDAAVYRFNATNIGNAVDSFTVTTIIPSPDAAWGVNVFPQRIDDLAPDASREISLSVSAPFEAAEGQAYTVIVHVASVGNATRFDEGRTVTTVVMPDIAVIGLAYRRADGSEVDGATRHLVLDETSHLAARVTNLRRNVGISNLRVRFVIDGANSDVTLQDLPQDGIAEAVLDHAFGTTGDHAVEAIADPYAIISDADRGNNQLSGTVGVKDAVPIGSFDIEGIVYRPDRVTPVPSATVRVVVPRTAYSFTVSTDGAGHYTASLADSRYRDGDDVVLNATDSRDFAQRTIKAYSEDLAVRVDLVLAAGVHYDVRLASADPAPPVDTGAVVLVPVTLTSTGNRAATVELGVATALGWEALLRNASGGQVTQVALPAGGAVDLRLEVRVPADAKGGTRVNLNVTATPLEDPSLATTLAVTPTVRARVAFSMAVTASPPGQAHPGDVRNHTLTVRNLGNMDDGIDLSYDASMHSWCVTFEQDPAALDAFSTITVRVSITVPAGTARGDYNITLSGLSTVNGSVVNNTVLTETVEDVRHLVELTPLSDSQQAKPGDTARWSVTVRNTGNVADGFELDVLGLGTGYVWALTQGTVDITGVQLDPGEQTTVLLEVTVPTVFAAPPASTTLQFDLKATSSAVPTSTASTRLTLALKGVLDLALEVSTSTNAPKAGGHAVFTLSVTNTGPDDATGVVVFAYFGDDRPVRKTIGDVKAQQTEDAQVDWWPAKEGTTAVRIVLNPTGQDFTFFELDRSNNEWNRTFKVAPATPTSILSRPMTWVVIGVILVAALVAYAMWPRGGRGREEEALEVAGDAEGPAEGSEVEGTAGTEGDGAGPGGGEVAEDEVPEPAPPPKRAVAGGKAAPPRAGPTAGRGGGGKGGQAPSRKQPPKHKAGGAEEELKRSLSGGRI